MFRINKKEEKILKNIRFPKSLIKQIEKEAKKNKVSFTRFVVEACIYAIDNSKE